MISILMPVYNTQEDLLIKSIDSCLRQTFNNFELIIINNGSDNLNTLKVLEQYSVNTKIKIYDCYRHKNKKNISIALNYGLKKCNFNLIARMDSDDYMLNKRLEIQLKYLQSNPAVDILGGQIIINNKQITNHPNIITKKIAAYSSWFMNHPTVLFKKDKILNIGGYKEEPEHLHEDYELWLRSLTNNLIIHNVKEIVLQYNFNENNETTKVKKKFNDYDIVSKLRMEFITKNDIS